MIPHALFCNLIPYYVEGLIWGIFSITGRMIHIGQLIKQELEDQGRTVVWFARKMSYSRTNIYKIFDRSSIDTDTLMRISVLLGVDFFKAYSSELDEHKDK